MSYQTIKDALRAAEQDVEEGNLEQAHVHVLEAVQEGASLQDISVNLSLGARKRLGDYSRRVH